MEIIPPSKLDRKKAKIIALLCFIVSQVIWSFNHAEYKDWYLYSLNFLFNIISICSILFFISSFSDKHKSNINIFDYSFFIFAIHPFLLECVQKAFYINLTHSEWVALIDYILSPMITICIPADGVTVDLVGQGVNQPDDALGHGVARGGLCPEQEGLGPEVHVGIVLELLIQADDVQHVQQLALVLMEPLDLDVEDGVGVQSDSLLALGPAGKGQLVVVLDGLQPIQHGLVSGKPVQTGQASGVGNPKLFVFLLMLYPAQPPL